MANDAPASKLSSALRVLIASGACSAAIMSQFLDEREGFSLPAYQDGVKVWTACRGVTTVHGKPIARGQVFTKAECDELDQSELGKSLAELEEIVAPEIFQTLTEPARAGIASFCTYNIGGAKCRDSSFLRLLNRGPTYRQVACSQIRLWIRDKGKDCRVRANNCFGQVTRREQEEALCLHGVTWGVVP